MYGLHREEILKYEGHYGQASDGTPGSRGNMITQANNDYQLVGTERVDTLVESLDPAKSTLIAALNAQHPNLNLNPDSYRSTDIYLDPGVDSGQAFTDFNLNHRATLDARLYKGGAEHDRSNLLIGEGGDDILFGDRGADVLIGGAGNDTLDGGAGDDMLVGGAGKDAYVLRAGGGNDRIYDEDGVGDITFIDTNGNRVRPGPAIAVPGVPNTWSMPYPGGGQITYTMNSPLTIHLPDGTTVVVEDFSNGQLGIDLRPEAPEVRETVVGGVGDEFLYPQSYEARHLGNAKVEGQAGHDAISGTLGVDSLDGGDGNDAMSAGLGDDRIIGGAGNDVIDTGPGKDIVEAGEGDDLVTSRFAINIQAAEVTAQGNVLVSLNDVWQDIARHYHVTVTNPNLPSAAADGYLHWAFNLSIGSEPWTEALPEGRVYDEAAYVPDIGEGAYGGTLTYRDNNPDPLSQLSDRVYRINFPYVDQANADPKVLYGGAGNDRLLGADGADVIYGEADQDLIEGGGGNDALFGGPGDDQVVAGADEDYVSGDSGNDTLRGESGADRLYGGEGNDYIEGDSAASALYALHGDDVIDGEGGDDTLFGEGGNDTLYGGDGNDQLVGDESSLPAQYHGSDTLYGEGGNDRLFGDAGNDTLDGGDGDDLLLGGAGDDTLDGDAGADELQGGDGQDTLEGGEGADLLFGEAGNDELSGGTGDDALYGEAGDDVYVFNAGDGVDSIDDAEGVNRIRFGGGIALEDLILGQASGGNGEAYLTIRYTETDLVYINGGLLGADSLYEFADGTVVSHAQLMQRAPALFVTGTTQSDVIEGGPQNDTLYGKTGDDTLRGSAGNDNLYGGLGSDVLEGGDGDDRLFGYEPYATEDLNENDTLYGARGTDSLYGGKGDDTYLFDRGDGYDAIHESSGFDTLRLGAGIMPEHVSLYRAQKLYRASYSGQELMSADDSLVVVVDGSATQIYVEDFFGDATGGKRIEKIVFDDGKGPVWTLEDINARVIAGSVDVFNGTTGDDTFAVDNIWDKTIEAPDAGIDTVNSSVSYILLDNVENLTLTGVLHSEGTGNNLNNIIHGNTNNNRLEGGAGDDQLYGNGGDDHLSGDDGADQLYGGMGDDSYDIRGVATVVENAGAGYDTVFAYTYFYDGATYDYDTQTLLSQYAYTLPDNVEKLVVSWNSSPFDVIARGNSLDNVIQGNVDGVVLDGMAGADTMIAGVGTSAVFVVDNPGDVVIPDMRTGISDTVKSSIDYQLSTDLENLTLMGSDPISATGNELNNLIDGFTNSAANVLRGGMGDDTYILGPGDIVKEAPGEGIDKIQIRTYASSDFNNHQIYRAEDYKAGNVEIFELTGKGAQQVTLFGDAQANILRNSQSSYSVTTLNGGAGDDILEGGSGVDILDGGGGADTMSGGTGSDTYVVDDVGDTIYDHGGGDTVRSSISYSLGNALENLELIGTEPINGTGNALDNGLSGSENPAANVLTGGAGNDTYWIGAGDSVVEQEDGGIDTVYSYVPLTVLAPNLENIIFDTADAVVVAGNELDNKITGSRGNDTLHGGSGDDALHGGEGDDLLDGGIGDDTYLWGWGSGKDTIDSTDTTVGKRDVVQVSETSARVTVTQNATDLVLSIVDRPDQLTIRNYFASANPTKIEEFRFSDGVIWTPSDIAAKFIRGTSDNDTLLGTAANDTITGIAGDDTLSGGDGHDVLAGDEGDDALFGEAGTDSLMGGPGSDLLDGGPGGDGMQGGTGDDTYSIDDPFDRVMENPDEGIDTVKSPISYTLESNLEDLILTDTATISGTGNVLDNTLTGNSAKNTLSGGAGNDLLDGGGNADALIGGTGDDTYIVDTSGDVVTENSGEGTDTIKSAVTYTLAENVENLVLLGVSAINGTGNALNNTLAGNSANNALDGGLGADSLAGGAGNDTYVVDHGGDAIIENLGEGTDTVKSSVTYSLPPNVENLTLTGTTAIDAVGNDLANSLTGNSADNALSGDAGADTLIGNAGNDYLDGGTEADQLTGGAGDDTYIVDTGGDVVTEKLNEGVDTVRSAMTFTLGANLENLVLTGTAAINGTRNGLNNVLMGNSADNTLKGGTGADTAYGGAGNDLYIVDNSADSVVENPDEGVDSVQSSVTWTLSANTENLTLTGSSASNGTGNSLDNRLTGNSAINVLRGEAGNDVLDGKAGADKLYGGSDDDTYIVDNTGDVVTENPGEGVDSVKSSVTYTLGANIEHLTLTGTYNRSATGNDLGNTLTGNSAANTLTGLAGDDLLDGGAGADTLRGGSGNDTYVVDNTGDTVNENAAEGIDTVQSSISYMLAANVEHLVLTGAGALNGTGNTLDNAIHGNSAANALSGGNGADMLEGGAGNDTLMGGSGGDRYLFSRGDGRDLIQEQAGVAGENDSVQFGPGLDPDQLWFSRSGDDLSITVLGGPDGITIQKWYSGSEDRVEEFHTTDGSVLYESQVQQLVQAMAAFDPPAAGETELSPQMREQLDPVLAAAWDTQAA
ncbi:MAG: calcium-binding protein [Gammaproteobacteria bacterium]